MASAKFWGNAKQLQGRNALSDCCAGQWYLYECMYVVKRKGWKRYQKNRAERIQAFSRVEMFCSNNGYNDFGNSIFLFPPF